MYMYLYLPTSRSRHSSRGKWPGAFTSVVEVRVKLLCALLCPKLAQQKGTRNVYKESLSIFESILRIPAENTSTQIHMDLSK